MTEYRPVPDEYHETYHRFLDYAFAPEAGPQSYESDDDVPTRLADRRGLFDGDDLRAVCGHHWFTTRIRGDWHEMAGLSAVASPPESRRQGLVVRLLRESLVEYRDRDVLFSALWPFEYEFYRRYGWATVTRFTKYETTPEALALDTDPEGEFRRLDEDDWELLAPVLEAHGEDYALSIDRTEDWWRERTFDSWGDTDPYVYGWFRDDEARAYLVYTVEDEDGKRLDVNRLAYVDHEAYRHLLRFLHYHDSQVEAVHFYEPENADLLDLVTDPREVDCEIKTGPMFRLVDVPRALERVVDSECTSGRDGADRVVLAVTDPLVDWNEGTFALDVSPDSVECSRVDADPDVRTDVNALSQVVAGYHSVREAEQYGNLTLQDDEAGDLLAALFPPRDVFLREGF